MLDRRAFVKALGSGLMVPSTELFLPRGTARAHHGRGSGGAGGGGGGTAPSAVPTQVLFAQDKSSQTMTWAAATPGTGGAIANYKIYRNGSLLTTVSSSTFAYTDSTATNSIYFNVGGGPSTIYSYAITAIDVSSNEGPTGNMTAWLWNGSSYFIGSDFVGGCTPNYSSSDSSFVGPYDIAVAGGGGGNYFQPATGGPGNTGFGYPSGSQTIPFVSGSPGIPDTDCIWGMELGAFNYMVISLKPTISGQTMYYNIISRGPPGDIYNNTAINFPTDASYGPYPMVQNAWNTYKFPLNQNGGSISQQMGTCSFMGYMTTGGLLYLTTDPSGGALIQPPMFITGSGAPTNCYVVSPTNGNGGMASGPYTISPSPGSNIGSSGAPVLFFGQRTNLYKINVTPNDASGTVYYNGWGFTQS